MNALIKEYAARAELKDIKDLQMLWVISYMIEKGIIKDITYQRFINLEYQLRKVVFR